MGGGGGKSGNHTTTSIAQPWGPVIPYIQQGLQDYTNFYGQGYPGAGPSTVAPLSGGQTAALQGIQNLGLGNQPLLNMASGAAAQGMGFQDPTLGAWVDRMGYQNAAMGGWQDMVNNPFSNEAMDLVRREAAGENVGGNPYLDAMYDKASQAAVDRYQDTTIPGIVSGMVGRFGSGSFANQLNQAEDVHNRGLTDLATDMYGRAYETDRGRQLQSQALLGNLSQQDYANQVAALQNLQSGQALQEQLQREALGQYGQGVYNQNAVQQSWADRASPYTMAHFDPLKQALGAGSIEQQQRDRELQDRYRQWQQQNFGPTQWSQNYLQTLGGLGNLGGTSIGQQPIYGGSPFMSGAGLGLSALGAGLNPWAAGAIGLGGMLLS